MYLIVIFRTHNSHSYFPKHRVSCVQFTIITFQDLHIFSFQMCVNISALISSLFSTADAGKESAFLRSGPQLCSTQLGRQLQEGQRLPHHVRQDQRSPDQWGETIQPVSATFHSSVVPLLNEEKFISVQKQTVRVPTACCTPPGFLKHVYKNPNEFLFTITMAQTSEHDQGCTL